MVSEDVGKGRKMEVAAFITNLLRFSELLEMVSIFILQVFLFRFAGSFALHSG